MDLIRKEIDKEFSALNLKSQRKNLRVLDQVGGSDKYRDIRRKALAPGKRISKSGKIYWETRKNRSDTVGGTL